MCTNDLNSSFACTFAASLLVLQHVILTGPFLFPRHRSLPIYQSCWRAWIEHKLSSGSGSWCTELCLLLLLWTASSAKSDSTTAGSWVADTSVWICLFFEYRSADIPRLQRRRSWRHSGEENLLSDFEFFCSRTSTDASCQYECLEAVVTSQSMP